jgi:hypothetical protein
MTAKTHTRIGRASRPEIGQFLDQITLRHGPTELFARMLLEGATEVAAEGIALSIGTAGELLEANLANAANWLPLFPGFDPRNGGIGAGNFLCVFGRSPNGEIVACHAARLYEWPSTSFYDEMTSLRLLYAEPEKKRRPGERCIVTAKSTHDVTGRVVYSGAAWYRPDYRGRGLSRIVPRIGKVLASSCWQPDWIVSLMTEDTHRAGFAPRFGYTNVDWEVRFENSHYSGIRIAFLSMDSDDVIDYAESYLVGRTAQIDRMVGKRRA